jgi:hypothetical protein
LASSASTCVQAEASWSLQRNPAISGVLSDSLTGILADMPRNKRRRNTRMTAVIATAGATELVTLLNWLSQYPGGRLRGWQLPALIGAVLLTGWLAIGQGGAAQNHSAFAY